MEKYGYIDTTGVLQIAPSYFGVLNPTHEDYLRNGFKPISYEIGVEAQTIETDIAITVYSIQSEQPQQTNEQLRAQEYEMFTNKLIPIWTQSRELGQLEQYEAEHAEWLRLVEEIKAKYPIQYETQRI